MQTTTIEERATSSNVKFDEAQFLSVANSYGSDNKLKRVVDAIVGFDNIDETIAKVKVIIGHLEAMSDNGAGYTPNTDLGFGSDNGAVVAEKILGRSASAGAVRKLFASLSR